MSATRKRPRTADGAQDLRDAVRGAHDATLETRLRDAFGEVDGYALAATATAKRRANGCAMAGVARWWRSLTVATSAVSM